jgi:LuxR family transcriptional regulator, maltose regulon positive regulatory protein
MVRGRVALSRVRGARGDPEGAIELADEAARLARESGAPQAIVDATLWEARLHLMRNDLQAAASDVERASEGGDVPRSARESERISLARLLVAREDYDEALRLLGSLRETADGRSSVIEILVLRASALWAGGKREEAVSTLAEALVLAEPEGYVRTLVDEGPPMAELLSAVLQAQQRERLDPVERIPAHYLRKLLAASERDAQGTASTAAGLAEPLSERELEVLQLIAAGKTNRRIASELFVSVGTVKTHINNLYRKLDAHSRTQALARATELNLL